MIIIAQCENKRGQSLTTDNERSTTNDYTKFVRALFAGNILATQQFAEMTNLVCADNKSCKKGVPIYNEL